MKTIEGQVPTRDDVLAAVEVIKKECKDGYALAYATALPDAVRAYGSGGFITQLRYIVNNLQTWRGETARTTKSIIQRYLAYHD